MRLKKLLSILLCLIIGVSAVSAFPKSAAAATKVTVDPNCVKVLLVGNSYTYYNGIGEILSHLGGKSGKKLLVVRATKGHLDSNALLSSNALGYVAWYNGTKIDKGSKKTLKEISAIDFGSLGRKNKWDFVVSQNNAGTSAIASSDVKMFNFFKDKVPSSKNFILHCTYVYKSLSDATKKAHAEALRKCNCSMISSKDLFIKYRDDITDPKDTKGIRKNILVGTSKIWYQDLTNQDEFMHQSAKGAYLEAATIYAKLYGTSKYPATPTGTSFIKVYNKDKGKASEFITDVYKQKSGTDFSMSVNAKEAAYFQYLVRANYNECVGEQLYLGTYAKITKASPKADGKIVTKYKLDNVTKSEAPIYKPRAIKTAYEKYVFKNKPVTPKVTVVDSKNKAIAASNYTVKYTNNKKIGTATITVTFKGTHYTGQLTKKFNITPKKTSIKKLTRIKNGFTVQWTKPKSYQIGYYAQYSTDKKFKDYKSFKIKNPKTGTKTVTGLKKKKTYYVRICTYKKVGDKNITSDWSEVKKVKIKG